MYQRNIRLFFLNICNIQHDKKSAVHILRPYTIIKKLKIYVILSDT